MDFLDNDKEECGLVESVEFEVVYSHEELVLQVGQAEVLMCMQVAGFVGRGVVAQLVTDLSQVGIQLSQAERVAS